MAEFSTNPGDRSVGELEREVDRERERVSATIDELQARASVGSLVDQLVKAVGENGGEVSRNLGRSLRDNPLAAMLTGVGLAWLMAGSGRPRDEAQDWEDRVSDDLRYGRDRLSEAPMPSASSYGSSAEGAWPRSEYSDPSTETEEGGLRERVADVAGRVGEGVSDAVAGVRERASEMSHSAGARLARAGDTIREAGGAVTPSRRRRTSERGRDEPLHAQWPRHADRGSASRRRGNRDGLGSRRRRGAPTLAGRGSHVR